MIPRGWAYLKRGAGQVIRRRRLFKQRNEPERTLPGAPPLPYPAQPSHIHTHLLSFFLPLASSWPVGISQGVGAHPGHAAGEPLLLQSALPYNAAQRATHPHTHTPITTEKTPTGKHTAGRPGRDSKWMTSLGKSDTWQQGAQGD